MPWKKSTRTEIVHIVVTGYQKKKEPSKYYVFVIDVTWNNSERFEVYRRYSDFFSFQTALKSLFPGAAGRRNNEERVIPQLPKRIFVGRSHVARVAEARLEQINRYCQTIISLDPRLSESAHVVGFFSPRIGDKELPKLHLHRPASLHPEKIPLGSLFEEYCALAEYLAEDGSQVSFKPGDKVLVMSKDQSGWWMCGVDGKVGWAPPSYLKKCEEKIENESDESDEEYPTNKDSDDSGVGENSANEPSTLESSLRKFVAPKIRAEAYRAIDSYQANGPGQVSFEIGDTIHVLDKLEDGWWFVSNGREEGWAPCSYLEGDKEEEVVTNLKDVEQYYTVDDYQAEEEDEISFKKGITLDVLQKSLDGWWVVKLDKVVGLAPATFLKKLECMESEVIECPSLRKVSPPMTATSPLRTFQQPPRKQSVRAHASMRNRPLAAGRGANKQQSSPLSILPPIPADRPYGHTPPSPQQRQQQPPPAPPRQNSRESLSPREKRQDVFSLPKVTATPHSKDPLPRPRSGKASKHQSTSTSPEFSDSDPEENYTNYSFQHFAQAKKRAHRTSSSESSRTSSVSEEGTNQASPKRPVATPRKNKSPKLNDRSPTRTHSMEDVMEPPRLPRRPDERETSPRPPLPPRPVGIPRISKHKSLEEPVRPQRPRKSEIKRAKDRARAANPRHNSPLLMVVDEDGCETMSTVSSRSSKSSSSSKSAPLTGNNAAGTEKRRTNTDAETTTLLIPENPHNRGRRKSANDALYDTDPPVGPSSAPGGLAGDLMAGGINTQVADTLLKYIISSEDAGLKAALRDLIVQDSHVTESIHGD